MRAGETVGDTSGLVDAMGCLQIARDTFPDESQWMRAPLAASVNCCRSRLYGFGQEMDVKLICYCTTRRFAVRFNASVGTGICEFRYELPFHSVLAIKLQEESHELCIILNGEEEPEIRKGRSLPRGRSSHSHQSNGLAHMLRPPTGFAAGPIYCTAIHISQLFILCYIIIRGGAYGARSAWTILDYIVSPFSRYPRTLKVAGPPHRVASERVPPNGSIVGLQARVGRPSLGPAT